MDLPRSRMFYRELTERDPAYRLITKRYQMDTLFHLRHSDPDSEYMHYVEKLVPRVEIETASDRDDLVLNILTELVKTLDWHRKGN